MGTLYQSQAAAGYNSSPPPDDGSQGSNNQITWNSTIKGKLADPIKALADAINSQLTTVLDLSPRAISTNDSAVASDHWRTLQVTGTTTITLSDAATMTNKYVVGIANLGVATVTVTRATGANTINGTAADFTLAPKQAVMLGVNQAANGYNILAHSLASGAGINTIQATTSVVTPLVDAGAVNLTLKASTTGIVVPDADNLRFLGSPSARWQTVFTPIIDSGTTGSLSLKTNNGAEQVRVVHTGTPANAITLTGGTTPIISVTAGQLAIVTPGTSSMVFNTNQSVTPANQFEIIHTASAGNHITVTGSNGGNPTISTTAGSLAITPAIGSLGGTAATGAVGVPVIVAAGRATAQTAANASVATFTVGGADASFEVSANVLVTVSTTHNFNVVVAYTDEGNTARTHHFDFFAGGVLTDIIASSAAIPYHGLSMHLRAKASTSITISTSGTFTTVTYNVEGIIKRTA